MKLITKIRKLLRIDKYYKPKYKTVINIKVEKDGEWIPMGQIKSIRKM